MLTFGRDSSRAEQALISLQYSSFTYPHHWECSHLTSRGGNSRSFPEPFLSCSSNSLHVLLGRLHPAVLGQKDACRDVPGPSLQQAVG